MDKGKKFQEDANEEAFKKQVGRGTIEDILTLGLALATDVQHHENWLKIDNGPHAQRSLIRAIYAHIEGSVYLMKRFALLWHLDIQPTFSPDELIFLEEAKKRTGENLKSGIPRLNDKGEVELAEIQTGFVPNIKFAFNAVARLEGGESMLVMNDKRHDDFLKSIKIRDRLMHPKSVYCLAVTYEELNAVRRGYAWFRECCVAAMKAHDEAFKKRRATEPPPVEKVTSENNAEVKME